MFKLLLSVLVLCSLSCTKPEPDNQGQNPGPNDEETVLPPSSSDNILGSLDIPGDGQKFTLPIAAFDEAVSVSSSQVWLAITSTTDLANVAAGSSVSLGVSIQPNFEDSRRKAEILFKSKATGKVIATWEFVQSNNNWIKSKRHELPAVFIGDGNTKCIEHWSSKQYLQSSFGGGNRDIPGGYMNIVRTKENSTSAEFKTYTSGNCYSWGPMGQDDYMLFTFPNVTAEAGTTFGFYFTLASDTKSPKYFICEWFDGEKWTTGDNDTYIDSKYGAIEYSVMNSGKGLTNGGTSQYTSSAQFFRFEKALSNETVYFRIRAVGPLACDGSILSVKNGGKVGFPSKEYISARMVKCTNVPKKKRVKVLCIGNSFTYYWATAATLQELCLCNGVELQAEVYVKGGHDLGEHLGLAHSIHTRQLGGYDFAFLQDCSYWVCDVKSTDHKYIKDAQKNVDQIMPNSPNCQIIFENTWAFKDKVGKSQYYYGLGSYEEFDKQHLAGSKYYAQALNCWISPIGVAFAKARAMLKKDYGMSEDDFYTERGLYDEDLRHQNKNGSYLKACVNYCVLTGMRFNAQTSHGDIDPELARKFRQIAEETVLGHEADYYIER